MRQLSAAEERKIDEAMQLASSFARLSTHHDHSGLLTPRSTCSGSSKESLDSPGPGAAGGHVFRFGGLRRKVTEKEEKRTFVDGLSLTCNATDIFTPDAQVLASQTCAQQLCLSYLCRFHEKGQCYFRTPGVSGQKQQLFSGAESTVLLLWTVCILSYV